MKKTGVLLVHGLMGSPKEYGPLESVLRMEGYHTQTITLPGHGETPDKPFAEVTVSEILEHCLAEYEAFKEHHEEVVLVGHSLGGICSLMTAAESPDKLSGVVAFSAPYEGAYFINKTLDLLKVPVNVLVSGAFYVPECFTGFERPNYAPWMYPRLLSQTKVIFKQLQEALPRINVPVCLGHSRYDLSIPYEEMEKIALALNKADRVSMHTFERCGHQIFPASQEREQATQVVLNFIRESCGVTAA